MKTVSSALAAVTILVGAAGCAFERSADSHDRRFYNFDLSGVGADVLPCNAQDIENCIDTPAAALIAQIGPPTYVRDEGEVRYMMFRLPDCEVNLVVKKTDNEDNGRIVDVIPTPTGSCRRL